MGWSPFHVEGADRGGRWLVTCDHATNTVPEAVIPCGSLGIAAEDMARHIAYDVGALGVARHLAALLDSPLIHSDFSRLVIDANRDVDDPTLIMKIYDGTIIPANRHADAAEVEWRLDLCHRPYHAAYAALAARPGIAICAVHSFTPQFKGRSWRPWQVGILWAGDDRIARPLIAGLRRLGLTVGDNEPYSGHLAGDSIDRHALRFGRPNALVEVRNDLIGDEGGQRAWAERLAPELEAALEAARHDADLTQEETPMDDATRTELEAAAFRALRDHLRAHPEVQNIDLMNLAGFCRNCLARWYEEAAEARGIGMGTDEAREIVYGMPYGEWRARHQAEATPAQRRAFDEGGRHGE